MASPSRVPHLRGPVSTAGHDPGPVRAERDALHEPIVPLQFEAEGARALRPTPSPSYPDCPVTIRMPSGLNATLQAGSMWPLSSSWVAPVRASHTLTSGSLGPQVTIRLPSGLNAALYTTPVWTFSSRRCVSVRASHTLAVRSPLPVTMCVPSGLNATLVTEFVWPFNSSRARPTGRPTPWPFGRDCR